MSDEQPPLEDDDPYRDAVVRGRTPVPDPPYLALREWQLVVLALVMFVAGLLVGHYFIP